VIPTDPGRSAAELAVWYDVAMDTPCARGNRGRKPVPGFVKTALARHKLVQPCSLPKPVTR